MNSRLRQQKGASTICSSTGMIDIRSGNNVASSNEARMIEEI